MHTLVTTLGFYALCMPLVSCFFDFGPGRLWPIESSLTVAVSGYSRLLITVGNIEVQRMSWIPQALAFDQAEQCRLELKAGVECATDRIMNAKAAAAAAAATGMSAAAAAQRLVISTSTRYPAMSVCTGVGQSLSEKDKETDEVIESFLNSDRIV
jgi:hypothetical protein